MRLLISRFSLLFLVFGVFLNAQMFTRTKVAMGTFISISLYQDNKHHMQKAFNIINDVELSLSSYNPQAKIYQLNHNKTIDLDTYTYEALALSRKYYQQSDGYFNIAIGKVTKDLYKFGEEERIPKHGEVVKVNVSFKNLYFSKTKAFVKNNIKIDLGGMGKGYAVDKVTKYFQSQNIKSATIAASGDIRCIGECKIEVADPFSENTLLFFNTKDMGISTSGNYNRYVKSTKHNHLINPKLKSSQENFVSITLISKMKNSDLDAYATAASVMPIKQAYAFLEKFELAYIVMQSDKKLRFSKNIAAYTKDLLLHKRDEK